MKRIISILLAVVIAAGSLSAFAVNSAVSVKSSDEVINVIKLLGIANGDENGNMNFDGKVTRAQFAKMAVCASVNKDAATETKLNVSLFPDVKNSYWGAGYISVAINTGLINGYLDGTFRPDNTVKLEEAVTIALKLLGYTSSDFLSPYPSAQMAKYYSLDLDTGISAKQGDTLTRRECMQLLYNTLCAKTKSGVIYCTTLGYKTAGDGVIDYNSLVEEKLKGPFVVSGSNYKNIVGFDVSKATVYRDGKLSSASAISDYDVFYYIKEIETIWTYTDKAFGIVNGVSPNSINPTSVTLSGANYALSSDFSNAAVLKNNAYVMLVLDKNGTVCGAYSADSDMYEKYHDPDSDYLDMITATVTDPFVVTDSAKWTEKIPFAVNENTNITLNGKSVSASAVKENDVVYYSEAFRSVAVYRKTATGICTSIVTQNNSPYAVVLSGKTYTLATNSAKNKFSVGGQFNEDKSFVTLLLGMNDEAVDASSGDLTKLSDNSYNPTYLQMVEETISSPIHINDSSNLSAWKDELPFDVSQAQIFLNGVSASDSSVKYNDVIYYSEPFKSVWIFRDTQSGVINAVSSNTVTVANKTYSLATDKAKYKVSTYGEFSEKDYVTLVLGKDSEVIDIYSASTSDIGVSDNDSSYSEVVSSTLKGPYLVTAENKLSNLPFSISDATLYKGSNTIKETEIQPYDVYYYSELLKTVWIYRDTVTGTIESALPVTSPTTVVVSGVTYAVEASQASYDLSSLGSFHVGDDATLLLGKDGVVGVVPTNTISGVLYGVVTDTGTKEFKKSDGTVYTADYVTVTDTACKSYTYEFENKYLAVGNIVKVTYTDSVKIQKQSTDIGTGVAATLKNAIYNGNFANDCEIIDVSGSLVKKIYPSRIKGLDIDLESFTFSKIVLFYKLDNDNNIEKLILNDFTGDLYDYGVVVSSSNGITKYMTESAELTASATVSEGPACIKSDGISALRSYVEVEELTKTAVYDENDNEYALSNDVKVFIRNTASYTYSDIDEVIGGDYSFKAYYDKSPSRGGRIRVIIATRSV